MRESVWVSAFRPAGDDGGVGGFDWFFSRQRAAEAMGSNVADSQDSEHAVWQHDTELDPFLSPDAVTEEIDSLEWGWFPTDRKHTATVWTTD